MRVALVGVSCVGKTTVGQLLADMWDHDFVDFDIAVQDAFGDSIERIKGRCFNE
jgi:shikimate kinase